MKKILFLLIILLLIGVVVAESNKVLIINVHYEDEKLRITDRLVKPGNYPDRNVQPEYGHTLEILSEAGAVLYNIKFNVPNKLFVDNVNPGGSLSGGLTILSETDFAMILPHFDDAEQVVIYNEDGFEIASVYLKERFGPVAKGFGWFGLILLILGLGFLAFLYIQRRNSTI